MKNNNQKVVNKGWEKSELGDLLKTVSPPIKLKTAEYFVEGKFPIIDQGKREIVGYTNNNSAVFSELPAVIFGDHTKEVKFINFPFAVGADGVKIIDSVEIEKTYLKYLLEHAVKKLPDLGYSRHYSELKNIVVSYPAKPEQKAIAQVLSTADAAIHTTEKLIAQKELRKKWLMQQLLTGKKRLKGFDGEWKEMHLADFFKERNETKCNDLALLSIGQNGVYPQDESVKKDTSNADKSKYKRIYPGDIGYNTMRMWQGRSALSELEGIVSPAYTVVIPKQNAYSLFFSYLFATSKLMNLFWRNSQGLVDDTLNCKFKDFKMVKVFLPQTKKEQTAIAQVLQAADEEISLLKAKAEKLRYQKKGLIQQLLTGKKRLI